MDSDRDLLLRLLEGFDRRLAGGETRWLAARMVCVEALELLDSPPAEDLVAARWRLLANRTRPRETVAELQLRQALQHQAAESIASAAARGARRPVVLAAMEPLVDFQTVGLPPEVASTLLGSAVQLRRAIGWTWLLMKCGGLGLGAAKGVATTAPLWFEAVGERLDQDDSGGALRTLMAAVHCRAAEAEAAIGLLTVATGNAGMASERLPTAEAMTEVFASALWA